MNRQTTAVLDHDDADAASADRYRPDTYSGRLGDQLADRQTPVPKRVLRRVTPAEEIYDDTGDSSFLRAQTRIRVRRGLVPQSLWGKVFAGFAVFITLCVVIAGGLVVRKFLLHDSRFQIASSADVQIDGNSHVSRAQLLSIFGEDIGRNLFHVPLAQRRLDLETLPWVEHATVMRLLPDRLRVSVVERTPVAFVRQGAGIGLVDAYGVLLDMPEDDAHGGKYSFPVLTGIIAVDPLSTRAARMKIYQQFIHEIDSNGPKISDTLSEVDVSDPEDVKALIPDHSSEILVHFGDQNFLQRYQSYEQQLQAWRTQYPNLSSVDMRYDKQAVLSMGQHTSAPVGDAPSAGGAANVAVEPAPVANPVVAPAVVGKKSAATPAQVEAKTAAKPATAKKPVAPAVTAGKVTAPAVKPAVKPTATPAVAVAKTPAAAPTASKPQGKAAATPAATAAGKPASGAAPTAFSMQHPLTQAYDVPVKKSAAKPKSATKAKPGAKAHAAVVKSKKTAKPA
ncbi:MAG TPA: FtsQ-type POTRA domain-containing protein [Acidobacteriaceae bacterium]